MHRDWTISNFWLNVSFPKTQSFGVKLCLHPQVKKTWNHTYCHSSSVALSNGSLQLCFKKERVHVIFLGPPLYPDLLWDPNRSFWFSANCYKDCRFDSALCTNLCGLILDHVTLALITCSVTALPVNRILICVGFKHISCTSICDHV